MSPTIESLHRDCIEECRAKSVVAETLVLYHSKRPKASVGWLCVLQALSYSTGNYFM